MLFRSQFMAHMEYVIQRKKKGEVQSVNLRGEAITLTAVGNSVELVAGRGKPLEFARAISGNDALQADEIRIEKRAVIFNDGAAQL